MALRFPVPLFACGAVLAAVACSINIDGLAGRECSDSSECPESYACTALGSDGQLTELSEVIASGDWWGAVLR